MRIDTVRRLGLLFFAFAAVAVAAPGRAESLQQGAFDAFLAQHAYPSIYVEADPRYRGSSTRCVDTNAVVSDGEVERLRRVALVPAPDAQAPASAGRAGFEGQVAIDPHARVVFSYRGPKAVGEAEYAIARYSGRPPHGLERQRLPRFTLASIGIGSTVADLYNRFGVPAGVSAAQLTGLAALHRDYSGADGTYRYVGVRPNTPQSCRYGYAFAVRAKRVVAMRLSIGC